MIGSVLSLALAAAIPLTGVVGGNLRARAFFDANNVKVGDPMVLTVDFVGEADFAALHPPELARLVNRRDWKLDDESAKTDTYRDARRLTYRVRPLREGVLWFPSFEFEYTGRDGKPRTIRSNEIPVHAKAGREVVVEGMGEDLDEMPKPDALVTTVASVALTDDEAFAWRRACAKPTADAFAAFAFPEAKLNEARCAVLDGNWARALKIYGRLEWTTGQTPAIERGMIAALALKADNPAVELPVWRQVGRPVLRYGWAGRTGLVVGGLLGVALVLWLLGRLLRAVACLALLLVLLPTAARAEPDIFDQVDRMFERMHRQMNGIAGGITMVNGRRQEPVKVAVRVAADRARLQVGEPFSYIITIETPPRTTVENINIRPSQSFGMRVLGNVTELAAKNVRAANPSNVVRRLSVPVRYDVPFAGNVSFVVEGMAVGRREEGNGRNRFTYSFSNSFSSESNALYVDVKPLDTAGQPPDFSGIISEGMRVIEIPDILAVETNDVIRLTYRVQTTGYLPEDWAPEGAAYEMGKPSEGTVEWRRFFVADGAPTTPVLKVTYYDPRDRKYKTVKAGGTHVKYKQ